jgi:hypothetical protein
MRTIKVSAWLNQFDGHAAIDVAMAKEDFEKATRERWPEFLKGRPVKEVLTEGKLNPKGLQEWRGQATAHIVAGYQLAETMTRKYLEDFYPKCEGRGSRFRECVEALAKAGH